MSKECVFLRSHGLVALTLDYSARESKLRKSKASLVVGYHASTIQLVKPARSFDMPVIRNHDKFTCILGSTLRRGSEC